MDCGTRYQPTRDQLALAAEVTAPFDQLLPVSRLHSHLRETCGTWSSLRDLGLFAITLPDEAGGSGLGATEEALIVTELGRHLAAPSILATIGASSYSVHAIAPAIAASIVAAGYRRHDRIVMIHDCNPDFILVRNQSEAALFSAPTDSHSIDPGLWLTELCEVSNPGTPIAILRERSLLRLRLLDAAALVGVAESALHMAVNYAGVRQQFGTPIGSFQAIKHHCANMVSGARRARDQTTFAAIALDDSREDTELQIECALLTAGAMALQNVRLNIQIHGAIGFSDEADPHMLLKRAQLYINIAGGLEATAERIASIRPDL